MKTISPSEKLNNAIAIAEVKQKLALIELKEEFVLVKNKYEPSSLLSLISKNILPGIGNLKLGLGSTLATIGINYLTNKLKDYKQYPIIGKVIDHISHFFINQLR